MQGDAIRDIQGKFGRTVYPSASVFENNSWQGAFEPEEQKSVFRNVGSLSVAQSSPVATHYPVGYIFKASNVVPTADENRPKNVAVLFAIKATCE